LSSQQGYPACAGIDPQVRGWVAPVQRLPRMRGDRPAGYRYIQLSWKATPHARGSTLTLYAILTRPLGYPACAGIDLRHVRQTSTTLWLPRMRGDRPIHAYICSSV